MLEDLEKKLEETKLVKSEEQKPKSEIIEKVVKFSDKIRKEFGHLIKSVLIFGSAVRGDMKKTSDIDVFVIVDDTVTKAAEDLSKVTARIHLLAEEIGKIHVQANLLTEFWNWIRAGSPELINYLRYGYPIYDSGFIKPMKRLLEMGLIPPSDETISLKARASLTKLKRFRLDLKSMIFDLRYMSFDMIQAAIMYLKKVQADYKDAKKYLEEMVKEGKVKKELVEKFYELDKLWKEISHGEIEVNMEHLKKAYELTVELVEGFKELIPSELREGLET